MAVYWPRNSADLLVNRRPVHFLLLPACIRKLFGRNSLVKFLAGASRLHRPAAATFGVVLSGGALKPKKKGARPRGPPSAARNQAMQAHRHHQPAPHLNRS